MPENDKMDLLEIRAFDKTIVLKGKTYYDSHSRIFNILRLPAMVAHLFPQIRKRKIEFELRAFPSKERLHQYLNGSKHVPLMLSLFERAEEPDQ